MSNKRTTTYTKLVKKGMQPHIAQKFATQAAKRAKAMPQRRGRR